MPPGLSIPSDVADPIILADWLELLAITADDSNSSHGDLHQVLNRLGVENLDMLCSDTMRELNRRVEAAGESYPFSFSGTLLELKNAWDHYTPYVFCLLLSYCEEGKKKISGFRHEVMFEQLSCIAAKRYVGGNVLRFGHPRNNPLPPGFFDALMHISAEVGEWTVSRQGRSLRSKDGGLDLIAWKPFPDKRIGKLILFGHCASGANWDDKINELQPDNFCSEWLGGFKSPIVKSFFIPHRLPPEVFEHRAISAKLFFDRCRIAFWTLNDEFRHETMDKSVEWCRRVLQKVAS
ncbi:MAG: hypothetical protein ACYC7L_00210 [Nitrospirota bacterium]